MGKRPMEHGADAGREEALRRVRTLERRRGDRHRRTTRRSRKSPSANCPGASPSADAARLRARSRALACLTGAPAGAGARTTAAGRAPGRRGHRHDAAARAGTPLEQVPGNVQSFGARDLARQRPANIAEFLDANANSVTRQLAVRQSVPERRELPRLHRIAAAGYAAGIVGLPRRRAHQRDVRRHRELGSDSDDRRSRAIQLIPGSNPVFGLNTLGGALAVTTKSGSGESGGERRGECRIVRPPHARRSKPAARASALDAFVAGESDRRRRMARPLVEPHPPAVRASSAGTTATSKAAAGVMLADNHLFGTQALPLSMLDNPRQAYTWPEGTTTGSPSSIGAGSRLASATMLSGNAYYRGVHEQRHQQQRQRRMSMPPDPASPPAFNVDSTIDANGYGASLQLALLPESAARQPARSSASRPISARPISSRARNPRRSRRNARRSATRPFVLETDAEATPRQYGVYATDTLAARRSDCSDRVDALQLREHSHLRPHRRDACLERHEHVPSTQSAAGATWTFAHGATLYANWSQGMRVPSPVELTCADPNAPCTLPNIFVADPPLHPVIGTTVRARRARRGGRCKDGARRLERRRVSHRAAATTSSSSPPAAARPIRAISRISAARAAKASSSAASAAFGPFDLTARYSYTRATFETGFVENSPNNSTADADGNDRRASGRPHSRHSCAIAASCGATWRRFQRSTSAPRSSPPAANTRAATRTTSTRRPRAGLRGSATWTRATDSRRLAALRQRDNVFDTALSELRDSRRQLLPRPRQHVRACARGSPSSSARRARHSASGSGVRYAFPDGSR